MTLDVSVVIPTYNEQDNILLLINSIYDQLSEKKYSFEIIVVDDDSTDNTKDQVYLFEKHEFVRFISRKGKVRGLGLSVLEGFLNSTASVCVVMDADFSHPVSRLPALINPILNEESDICIGSRFVEGGGILGWPWYRHLTSRVSAFLGLGLTTITDITSGFMAINRSKIDFSAINPYSWKIVLEVAVKCENLRILDVPIVFKDRELGKSKISVKEYKAYLIHLFHLYVYKFNYVPVYSKFVCVGFLGLIIDMFIFFILYHFFLIDIRLASITSFLVAVFNNYLFNKFWTFAKKSDFSFFEFGFYLTICSFGLILRSSFMHLCVFLFPVITVQMALLFNLVAIFLATASNFFGSKFLFSK